MTELTYTPLSDGFKIAKNDDGNVVFARNDTTLFIASPDDLHASLTPLIGAMTGTVAVDTTSADALAVANAKVLDLQNQVINANQSLAASNDKIAQLEQQIAADKVAADAIAAAMAKAGNASAGVPLQEAAQLSPAASSESTASQQASSPASAAPEAPTIAPSNTGITGS